MESTFVECKECKKHWFNGVGLEMCDDDWNCSKYTTNNGNVVCEESCNKEKT